MKENQFINILSNHLAHNSDLSSTYNKNYNKTNNIKFNDYLIKAGYSNDDIAAENIRNDVEKRLQRFSLGSSNIKLNVSPATYKKMAQSSFFKRKIDEILNDFLSETGELSWMTKEARAGGGEISLTIDDKGNTTYTGKLYCIPGWENTKTSSNSSKVLSKKLKLLLQNTNLNSTKTNKYTDIIKAAFNKKITYPEIDINQLLLAAQLQKANLLKNNYSSKHKINQYYKISK